MTENTEPRAGAGELDWSSVLVTPEMAEAGAEELRSHGFGDRLTDVVTSIFYVMQAAAHPPAWRF